MADSNQLFLLIKSLTKSEKRYFKLNCIHTNGVKNHIKLFDAIDKQHAHDDVYLKKLFEKETFVKQFHVTKRYLHQQVLKSLVLFYANEKGENSVKSMIEQVKVLYKKNLLAECVKLLIKTKKLALHYELFLDAIWCLNFMQEIFTQHFELKKWGVNILEVLEEESQVEGLLINNNGYNKLQTQIANFVKMESYSRREEKLLELDEIMSHDLLKEEQSAISKKALSKYHTCYLQYFYATGDFEKAIIHSRGRVEIMSNNLHAFSLGISKVIEFMSAHIRLCILTQNHQEAESYRMKNTRLINENSFASPQELHRLHQALNIMVGNQVMLAKFEDDWMVRDVIEILEKRNTNEVLNIEVETYYIITYFYFAKKEFKKALFWNDQILNAQPSVPVNYYSNSKIMNLIIHYELANYQLLESLLRSTYRFMSKASIHYKLEKIIVKTIKKLITSKDLETTNIIFFEFEKSLSKIKGAEQNIFVYFDFLTWIRSKIRKEKFAVMLQDKYLKSSSKD
jgi:tetratricopeptide (TPR) repeat protein